jgi:hypothetical protein
VCASDDVGSRDALAPSATSLALASQAGPASSRSAGGGSEGCLGAGGGGNTMFMCDSMLGKAVKWLRCIGVDTVLWEGSRNPLVAPSASLNPKP